MSRKFIAAVLAVSTTIAAFTAAPARAGSEEDIARILGAAATIFIIGKAIQSSRKDDRSDDRRDRHDDRYKDGYEDTHRHKNQSMHQQHYYEPVPQVIPRHARPYDGKAPLPKQCVRRITGGKPNRVVMENCLERNYRSARELPRACRIVVATKRGNTNAYALPCLKTRGYTLAWN